MTTTIYTYKKTGETFIKIGDRNVDNKHVHVLENTKTGEKRGATDSVMARWFKKETVVDFTAAEEKPATQPKVAKKETKKAIKSTKQPKEEASAKRDITSFADIVGKRVDPDNDKNHIVVGCFQRGKISRRSISIKEARNEFGSITLDRAKAIITSDEFNARRVYMNPVTGCVFFRHAKELIELNDVSAVV